MAPILVVIGGLPASGKSTIAAALARRAKTPYIRVDRIERAMVDWSLLDHPVGPAGYAVAHTDPEEHRRRVSARASDVPGLVKPSWTQVMEREYEPWTRDRVLIDSARRSVGDAVAQLVDEITARRRAA